MPRLIDSDFHEALLAKSHINSKMFSIPIIRIGDEAEKQTKKTVTHAIIV